MNKELEAQIETIKLLLSKGLVKEAQHMESMLRAKYPEIMGTIAVEQKLAEFITQDKQMLEILAKVRVLAPLADTVMILGESGTGKEIIAQALHGGRAGKFIAINCTSLPDYLLESELFGHKRGSFTGAVDDKPGLFQVASRGTLFLDEIGDMPLVMQAKLLRVVQTRMIRPVGGTQEIAIDCRIVCATRQNPEATLREDLYYRLTTFILRTSPLRERMDDVMLILSKFNSDAKLFISDVAKKNPLLTGNVRYLEHVARRFQVFSNID